jgi:hypothetical protein
LETTTAKPCCMVSLGWSAFYNYTFWHVLLESLFLKAACGRTARAVVCPAKAGMFSGEETHRGRSQSPVA